MINTSASKGIRRRSMCLVRFTHSRFSDFKDLMLNFNVTVYRGILEFLPKECTVNCSFMTSSFATVMLCRIFPKHKKYRSPSSCILLKLRNVLVILKLIAKI
ncbi:hypothetical protein HOLleu_42200 [Holothuria leucospilota]|uniref:Uncharacterized protein n=1 Tax=Holothuria leucospilota TaxID=206669 RepID=A0A9Q0YBU2_HOLLE|nr:hypothetical protein HOLleu_42200 [Holothuria leucospilota]